ncbi:fam-a protein [Plasmodium yoelii]|uniref:Fam-a protein n=2 Tax=Plasmodium yoelii TaxID=5861 RepID=A0AAE9WL12_PLAYO|nr:fam-a protein [Plasmodium yoelii]WBY54921.1 fam-a protein [Plasmodium yoelii yoelii]CDU16197.1 fam-a protein [Plasmodium yoelii]VTZ72352.1 fam-a protein [Plasmodium yoelii]|eukprot:XP_022811419.1 fam-a protein [Plasmodium yoelii]
MNKFYIQIVFFLLTISLYVNNKALATELAPKTSTTSNSTHHYYTPEEIYEKNKHLLCTNPEETINAENLMNEAVTHLEYHAKSDDGYELYGNNHYSRMFFYKKKHKDHTDVLKITFKVYGSDMYNQVVNMFWDPDHATFINTDSVKIARVYTPNLIIILQRYKKKFGHRQKYFHALATKVEISEDATIIAYSSADINDHNSKNEKYYQNEIIENANLFKTDIDSEDDIKNGKLKKTFVNLAGYLIENKDKFVNITYVESINGHASF